MMSLSGFSILGEFDMCMRANGYLAASAAAICAVVPSAFGDSSFSILFSSGCLVGRTVHSAECYCFC